MKKPITFGILVAALYLVAWASADTIAPPTYVQKQGPASATLTVEKNEKNQPQIRLSHVLEVLLQVEGAEPLEVEPVKKLTASDGWHLDPKTVAKPSTRFSGNGRMSWEQTFSLEPLKPGELVLQMEPLRYREKSGDWKTVTWEPIKIKVTTSIERPDKPDVNQARDITGPEEVPSDTGKWNWLLWLGGAIVLLGLSLAGWQVGRRWARQRLIQTPEQWALAELDRMAKENLAATWDANRYHTLLSDVVRRYLEKRFQLPASRQTTPEFLQAMHQSPQLTPAQQDLLRDFLQRCDLAKFAGVNPLPEECQATVAMARGFIEQTVVRSEPEKG
jgi:hypothetical protein